MSPPKPPAARTFESPRIFARTWRLSAALVLCVVALSAVLACLLLSVFVGTGSQSQLRLDTVKTGLATAAGAAGIITLLYAIRRQLLSEQVAEDTRFDLSERRSTELYVKGIEQLGADNPVSRIGGLAALERLADSDPTLRETVAGVVCAYLRASHFSNDQMTRRSAQLLLHNHLILNSKYSYVKTYWSVSMVIVSGAELEQFNLDCGLIDTVHFNDCKFTEGASFRDVAIRGANFTAAQFAGDITFERAKLEKPVFAKTVFDGDANFTEAEFGNCPDFTGAIFSGECVLTGAKILGRGDMRGSLPDNWKLGPLNSDGSYDIVPA